MTATVMVVYSLIAVPTLSRAPLGIDSWRETDVLMVGRNFCREDKRLWLPRIDVRGDTPGITGMEFPLLNWIHGQLACAGIDQVLAARALSFLMALLAIACIGALAHRFGSGLGVVIATVGFAASPLVWYYGRGIQPDVPSLSLALLSLVLLQHALFSDRVRWGAFYASALTLSLGILIKLPVIVFGLPALLTVYQRFGTRLFRQTNVWIYGAIAVVPSLLWYRHARQLQEMYGLRHFFLGKPFRELANDWLRRSFYQSIFVEKLWSSYAYWIVSALAVGAMILLWRQLPLWLKGLTIATLSYFFLAGHHAAHHFYYGIPAVPALALLAAYGWQKLMIRADLVVGLVATALLTYLTLKHGRAEFKQQVIPPQSDAPLREAKARLDAVVDPQEKVFVFSSNDPAMFWFLDRRGWLAPHMKEVEWFERAKNLPRALVVDRKGIDDRRRDELSAVFASKGFSVLVNGGPVEVWISAQDQ